MIRANLDKLAPLHDSAIEKFQSSDSSIEGEPMPSGSMTIQLAKTGQQTVALEVFNTWCTFSVPFHVNLRQMALSMGNVILKPGKLEKKIRSPECHAVIHNTGKVVLKGCKSEADCMKAARSIARSLQRQMGKINEVIRIRNFKLNNVCAKGQLPWGVMVEKLNAKYPKETRFEPERFTGVIWDSTTPKACVTIFPSGSIKVLGAESEDDVLAAAMGAFKLASEFRSAERYRQTANKRPPAGGQYTQQQIAMKRPRLTITSTSNNLQYHQLAGHGSFPDEEGIDDYDPEDELEEF